jgi:hypothetical protein
MLNNTGRQIVNTREIEIITGYEITGQDEQGNNYYDYSKPKYSKMKAGTFKVGGNSNGKYVIINNLYKGEIEKDGTLSKVDREGERVLTQKGRIYAKVAKEIVEGNKEYVRFLKEGPLGKVGGIGEKIRARMEAMEEAEKEKGEIKYKEDKYKEEMVKDIKEITEALWEANIWEYEKVEKLYGFYGLLPEKERSILNKMSISNLKGIVNAQHREAVKGIAEQRGYKLPEAEAVELARLARGMKFEGEDERIGKYFGDILILYLCLTHKSFFIKVFPRRVIVNS